MTKYNLLDAVNAVLLSIGEQQVTLLNLTYQAEIRAVATVKESSSLIQARGWNCNTIENEVLELDANNEINTPSNYLQIIPHNPELIIRKNKLFNKTHKTYKFLQPETATIIEELEIENIPYYLAYYIVVHAIRLYQARYISSQILYNYTATDESEALACAVRSDTNISNPNMIHDNFAISTMIDRDNVYSD